MKDTMGEEVGRCGKRAGREESPLGCCLFSSGAPLVLSDRGGDWLPSCWRSTGGSNVGSDVLCDRKDGHGFGGLGWL